MKRTLTLRREALTDLATDELAFVVGAAAAASNGGPLAQCVISLALTGCGTSVNPKCPLADG